MNANPVFASTLQHFGGHTPPADATVTHIRQLEAEKAELARQLAFQKEATAQLAAQLEELCPHDTEAELPDGTVVVAPSEVVRASLVWLRGKHDLEWCARIDEQTLLHFEVEKAEARIAAKADLS